MCVSFTIMMTRPILYVLIVNDFIIALSCVFEILSIDTSSFVIGKMCPRLSLTLFKTMCFWLWTRPNETQIEKLLIKLRDNSVSQHLNMCDWIHLLLSSSCIKYYKNWALHFRFSLFIWYISKLSTLFSVCFFCISISLPLILITICVSSLFSLSLICPPN